ncbi:MAG: tRNA-binding protein [Bacteroidetes bacterium]|nr:MAG: tRNA-binding protein [Bacteroidota bacterium]
MLNWEDFQKVDIRTGTVISAEPFPQARKPAYILHIDFGPLGIKKTSAQITDHYNPEDLPGKQVMAVVNFPPKQIGPIQSECLLLGSLDENHKVVLLSSDKPVENGLRIG